MDGAAGRLAGYLGFLGCTSTSELHQNVRPAAWASRSARAAGEAPTQPWITWPLASVVLTVRLTADT